jgi:hypothetical protein
VTKSWQTEIVAIVNEAWRNAIPTAIGPSRRVSVCQSVLERRRPIAGSEARDRGTWPRLPPKKPIRHPKRTLYASAAATIDCIERKDFRSRGFIASVGPAGGTIPPPDSIAKPRHRLSTIPACDGGKERQSAMSAQEPCVSRERGFGPIKLGRCATHSEMPTTAVTDSGDRSRSA